MIQIANIPGSGEQQKSSYVESKDINEFMAIMEDVEFNGEVTETNMKGAGIYGITKNGSYMYTIMRWADGTLSNEYGYVIENSDLDDYIQRMEAKYLEGSE